MDMLEVPFFLFRKDVAEIVFLKLTIFSLGNRNFFALYFDIVAFDDVNCFLVDDESFAR